MKKQTQKTIKFIILTLFLSLVGNFSPVYANNLDVKNVVKLVNQSRTQHGLGLVYINSTLTKIAQDKAQDMTNNHYFAHTSPSGKSPWFWFAKNDYDYTFAGENLAINYSNVQEQHSAWMNSPAHRKNILNNDYREIGVGFSTGIIENKKANVTVQVFGVPQNMSTTTPQSKTNIKERQTKISTQNSIYLKQSSLTISPTKTTMVNISTKNTSFISSSTIKLIERQTQKVIWLIILLLTIVILRDTILKTITTPNNHAHRTANLVLLLMLWSILIRI